jgi:hypothetical protein
MNLANAQAQSNWLGVNSAWGVAGNWSAGVPNAAGGIAQLITPITANNVTYQGTAGVILGSLKFGNGNDMGPFGWQIVNTQGIALNGNGSGFSTISNSSTSTSNANILAITTGTITLTDELRILNTASASMSANGSIQIDSMIAGSGGLTFNGAATDTTTWTSTFTPGATRLSQASTFSGSILVQKGFVVLNYGSTTGAAAFGAASNLVTIGQSGSGSAGIPAAMSIQQSITTSSSAPPP